MLRADIESVTFDGTTKQLNKQIHLSPFVACRLLVFVHHSNERMNKTNETYALEEANALII